LEPKLPPAISGHNNYWMWGMHGCNVNLVIGIVGDTREELLQKYETVDVIGHMGNPLAMPYERKNIYLLRTRRPSAPFDWAKERFYF
jgi:hypothetical protein